MSQTDPPGQAGRLDADLKAIHEALHEAVAAEAQRSAVPLTPQQYSAMELLVTDPDPARGLSLGELAQRMGLAHSTVSGIVDRLARRGLVSRAQAVDDRRVTRIRLTDRVRDWADRDRPSIRHSRLDNALRKLDRTTREGLVDGLTALRQALDATGDEEH
ncbi:MarR family transcriptional regulator [Amycolatopsis sp. K13G38]|uniref:MarR family transcriptional regulator n=1 Tax=Amycolatopsis acididurans TaxID=2724524 RepID=A0ABX1JDJ2_9PSEU|nr:MarR family transcriptional regulator [Amycolatopsis acididurans]NKQ56934.1 MarR family transcriptional regulator [Amycolatopsis acididurans]